MKYSAYEIALIKEKIFQSVQDRFTLALKTDTLDELMNQYQVYLNDEGEPQIITRKMKILVVGDIRGRWSSLLKAAKSLSIPEENLDLIEFDKFKSWSLESLRHSSKYSDIIVGPIPHKGKDLGKDNSLIAKLENAESRASYPNLIKAIPYSESNGLKYTITDFKRALLKSRWLLNNA